MIPALTLTQPWATLVMLGAKRIETRSWRTPLRGTIAIHAAKEFPKWARETCQEPTFAAVLGSDPLPLGKILGTCRLISCVPTRELQANGPILVDASAGCGDFLLSERERGFGDYSPGRWAWLLADIKPLPDPEPATGALGLWQWDDALYWKRREDYGPNGDATTPGFFK